MFDDDGMGPPPGAPPPMPLDSDFSEDEWDLDDDLPPPPGPPPAAEDSDGDNPRFLVHALDASFAADVESGEMDRRVTALEGGGGA